MNSHIVIRLSMCQLCECFTHGRAHAHPLDVLSTNKYVLLDYAHTFIPRAQRAVDKFVRKFVRETHYVYTNTAVTSTISSHIIRSFVPFIFTIVWLSHGRIYRLLNQDENFFAPFQLFLTARRMNRILLEIFIEHESFLALQIESLLILFRCFALLCSLHLPSIWNMFTCMFQLKAACTCQCIKRK